MSEIAENDLHAYVDDALDPGRRAEVEAWLASNPEAAERIAEYRRQNAALRIAFNPVLEYAIPRRLRVPTGGPGARRYLRHAAAVGWLALGGLLGWGLHGATSGRATDIIALPRQAAMAHAVYAPEVRHPVEVGADQQAHLVAWLSKRLGAELKAPQLSASGFELVGGRLLPGNRGPVAQFMYQDAKGQRLTLYVRTDNTVTRETAFRYSQEGNVSVFYWLDGKLGYALSGEIDKADLLRIANTVYRQLNP